MNMRTLVDEVLPWLCVTDINVLTVFRINPLIVWNHFSTGIKFDICTLTVRLAINHFDETIQYAHCDDYIPDHTAQARA
eukprot:m51a1_g8127 hypothetical protein (79) ;mRNA; r:206106-206342